MIVLDTDHISVMKYVDTDRYNRLTARLATTTLPVFTTIITFEEQMRGWLATIAKERKAERQVNPYRELGRLLDFFTDWSILPFDTNAAARFEQLAAIRINTMDRKIAAITLCCNATLLTANRQDFEQVPGLRFENWMDPPA